MAMERSKNAASSYSPAQVHIIMLTGSMQEAPEIQIPSYYGHTAVVPTVSTLERHLQLFIVAFCVTEIAFLTQSLLTHVPNLAVTMAKFRHVLIGTANTEQALT